MHPLIAASEAAAKDGDKISPILAPYPGLMFWTIVAFFLTLWVLKRFAFGPIQDALDKRRETINGAIEHAERLRDESQALLAQYEQKLSDARSEADGIIERARKAGDELTSRVKAEGEAQRQEQLAQIQKQVQAEVEKASGELRADVAEMTVLAAEKVLRGSLDRAQHQELIDKAVAELDFDRLQKVGAQS